MPLSESVKVSLAILQTIGLLIPVVFLSLQSYFPETLPDDHPFRSDGGNMGADEIDVAPRVIRLGWLMVGFLAVSGVFAAIRVILSLLGSWLVVLSVMSLTIGLLLLALIFYEIRSSMTINVV